ncbi:DUF4411 family protein [Hymenobacter sp. HD11105]
MTAIIDTSSLLAIVRYYLPFDINNKLKKSIQALYESGELVIIDKVAYESRFQSKGIILEKLDFISAKPKLIVKTDEILPDRKFFNRLENEFCNKNIITLKGLDAAEFDSQKNSYVNNTDAKIILYAMKVKVNNPVVVTEETIAENDGKVFKKIPNICSLIGTDCCTLPALFKDHCCMDMSELFK